MTRLNTDIKVMDIIDVIEKAIISFQWTTNAAKLNPEQHVRLGDAIVSLHDLVQELKKEIGE